MQTNPSLDSTDGVFVGVYKAAFRKPAGAASSSSPVRINKCNPVIPATSHMHFFNAKREEVIIKKVEIIIINSHPKLSKSG